MTELGGSPQARGCPAAAIVGERQCRLARLHELVSEILRTPLLFEPPYYSPGTFRVPCFGGAPVLAGGRFPAGGTRPF